MFIFNCTNVVLLPELSERFVSIVNRNISFQYNTGVIEFNILVDSNGRHLGYSSLLSMYIRLSGLTNTTISDMVS